MGVLTLYALELDDVCGFFGASEPSATRQLEWAAEVTSEPIKPKLLGKVGPLFKHPVAPIMEIPVPTMDDARSLIEGRTPAPERLRLAWVIVQHWCKRLALGSVEITLDRHQLAAIDFAVVSRGLSSQNSLETILTRNPHLPLLPPAGLMIGWMPHTHVAKAASQWPSAVGTATADDELADDLKEPADRLARFFEQAQTWTMTDVLALYQ